MRVIEESEEASRLRAADPQVPWVLVPTMGALHEGHLALIHRARELAGDAGKVITSIFVNPLQFDRAADLKNYPRTLESDLVQCREAGVDFVFAPEAAAFFTSDHSTTVAESLLSRHLCGATRPGHFDGVCTVVLKLFLLLGPTAAIFGKKDYQQLAIIRRMVRDLSVPVDVHGLETVREPDGLALSSRNQRLTQSQRLDAPRIRRALIAARDLVTCGEQRVETYLRTARHHLETGAPGEFAVDYLELVDKESLQPLAKVTQPALLATACFYDAVRLIDNIEINP